MAKLLISLPDAPEQTFELTESTVTIGRVSDNTIQIDHASVSSHHAELTDAGGGDYRLKDLDSTNGTRLNGERVTEENLRDGDKLRFGQVEAAYASDISSEERPMPKEETVSAAPAAASARPSDFSNASPFATKKKQKNPAAKAIMAFAIFAILVSLGAIASILMLAPPALNP